MNTTQETSKTNNNVFNNSPYDQALYTTLTSIVPGDNIAVTMKGATIKKLSSSCKMIGDNSYVVSVKKNGKLALEVYIINGEEIVKEVQ